MEYPQNDKKRNALIEKKKLDKIRVTTYLSSALKLAFTEDCLKRSRVESQVAKAIIQNHYEIINSIPNGSRMEFIELKKYILDKIKL